MAERLGEEPVVSTRVTKQLYSYSVEAGKEYAIEVTADAQANGEPLGRRVTFAARGWSQQSLLEHPDKYRVIFLGQKKELEGREDGARLEMWLWEYKPNDYAAVVATQHFFLIDDMSCVVVPLRVTPVEDPRLGVIAPTFHFRPDVHAQLEGSSTVNQRLAMWTGIKYGE